MNRSRCRCCGLEWSQRRMRGRRCRACHAQGRAVTMSSLWVLSILDAHDWIMAELARRCGSSREAVVCWGAGKSRPNLDNLIGEATAHISAQRERSPMIARRAQSARPSRNVTPASHAVTAGHVGSQPVQYEAA
jgi:hypothetical protein